MGWEHRLGDDRLIGEDRLTGDDRLTGAACWRVGDRWTGRIRGDNSIDLAVSSVITGTSD